MNNRIIKLVPLKKVQVEIDDNRENYLIIIILKTITKYIIHYQIKNLLYLKKLPKRNLNLISKRK